LLAILEGGPEALAIVDRLLKTIEDASDKVKDRLRGRRAHPGRTDAVPGTRLRIEFSTGRSYRSYDGEMMRAGALAEVPPPPRFPPGFFKNTNAIIGRNSKGGQLIYKSRISVHRPLSGPKTERGGRPWLLAFRQTSDA